MGSTTIDEIRGWSCRGSRSDQKPNDLIILLIQIEGTLCWKFVQNDIPSLESSVFTFSLIRKDWKTFAKSFVFLYMHNRELSFNPSSDCQIFKPKVQSQHKSISVNLSRGRGEPENLLLPTKLNKWIDAMNLKSPIRLMSLTHWGLKLVILDQRFPLPSTGSVWLIPPILGLHGL